LTSLPYTVLLTHGHFDHVGGAFLYDSVYIGREDTQLLRNDSSIEQRKEYLRFIVADSNVPMSAYVAPGNVECLPIHDGDRFELGVITVEAIATPGHTPGSLSFLLFEKRLLLTGDACNSFTFMFGPEALSIEAYRKSLKRLLERSGEYDAVLLSHRDPVAPKSVIQDVYDTCSDIMNGNTDDVPFSFIGRDGALAAKRIDADMRRVDGRFGNIVYNKNNVFSGK
jgi:hydroxyacylglutathione hydrolase